MFGLNGIGRLEAPHSAIAKSVQRLKVNVTSSQGEIAITTISADTYRLSIQVPGSWLIPSAPRMSTSAIAVTWSLNSDVIAAMRTPPRPIKGLMSIGPPTPSNKRRLQGTWIAVILDCSDLGLQGSCSQPDYRRRHDRR